ncbi:Cysteine-rich_membrane protein 2 [Hexamita inflata]|uniref:Cysteine-rich membrane protein 2 n=1 Tax=Hexamita inflata TaxID=28002 RepID=A0AA86PSR4_9EUKA|nr:Cysteine-rich membrane protein 2 [Hexamita inflata]
MSNLLPNEFNQGQQQFQQQQPMAPMVPVVATMPYQQMPQQMQPVQYQPVQAGYATPNVVIAINTNRVLSCGDIVCGCEAPQFQCCQCFCGFCTVFFGSGLEWCCCYGCDRPDCCAVCCAGCGLQFLSTFIYGIVVGCIVGCKMMCD